MEKINSDVVVLGSGGAGLAASITAAEQGLKVVLLEKRAGFGGNSNTPAGVSIFPKDQAYKDKLFTLFMDATFWRGNAPLIRNWIEEVSLMDDFLNACGVPYMPLGQFIDIDNLGIESMGAGGFTGTKEICAGFCGQMLLLTADNDVEHGGAKMIRCMIARAKELGVDIRNCTFTKSLIKINDTVVGVLAENKAGIEFEIHAKAVILASGGFNEDREMMKKFSGFGFNVDFTGKCDEGDFFFLWRNQQQTGDGQKLAWEAGADKGAIGLAPFPHVPGPGIISAPWIRQGDIRLVAEQPYLWVNKEGQRFLNEVLIMDHVSSGFVLARQTGHCGFMIFDEDTKKQMEKELDYIYFVFPAENCDDIDSDFDKCIAEGNRHVFYADTLEEIADKFGIDRENLRKTVTEYNGYCEKKHDDQFAKSPEYLRPVKNGRFYALRAYCTAYGTMGGIHVSGKTEAMTVADEVIHGLYAAGDICVAELFGNPMVWGVPSIGFALASGRIAARAAADYIGGLVIKDQGL